MLTAASARFCWFGFGFGRASGGCGFGAGTVGIDAGAEQGCRQSLDEAAAPFARRALNFPSGSGRHRHRDPLRLCSRLRNGFSWSQGLHRRLPGYRSRLARHLQAQVLGSGLRQLVTRNVDFQRRLVIADALHFVLRRLHVDVGDDDDVRAGALLDLLYVAAFLVEQVGSDVQGHERADQRAALLQRLFFHHSQDRQRQRPRVANAPLTAAAGADLGGEVVEGRPQSLPRHLQKPEAGDAPDLHPGAVGFERLAHLVLDGALILDAGHVDEVDDDEAADVTQAQLPGNLLGRFEVGIEGGFFDVRALGGPRRVDVDGHQRLCRVDHQAAAGWQAHAVQERGLDLALDLVAAEQRDRVGVELHLVGVVRHDLLDEGFGFLVGLVAVDEDFADVLAQVVANGPHDDVVFLIDQRRCLLLAFGFFDRFPQLQQVVEVPLQLLRAAAHARGTHDHAHALRNGQLTQGVAQFFAIVAFDAPGDPTGARIVGHQHQIAPGQADEGSQRRALGAALLFIHLHQDFLTLGDRLLDHDATTVVAGGLVLRGFREVFAADLLEREKAVTIGAEIDEGRLQARLDAGDAGFVDAGFLLLPAAIFDVEVVQLLSVNQCDAHLFGLSSVDQHSFHSRRIPQCGRLTAPYVAEGEAVKSQSDDYVTRRGERGVGQTVPAFGGSCPHAVVGAEQGANSDGTR